ncbi:hypothetical protein M426DRAFT_22947 [Hypoxylon sp. CI-4A]|nr:hypothetical protein M426DRAFT_22947 [Hypoxylon sp. CI-4A]
MHPGKLAAAAAWAAWVSKKGRNKNVGIRWGWGGARAASWVASRPVERRERLANELNLERVRWVTVTVEEEAPGHYCFPSTCLTTYPRDAGADAAGKDKRECQKARYLPQGPARSALNQKTSTTSFKLGTYLDTPKIAGDIFMSIWHFAMAIDESIIVSTVIPITYLVPM